MFCLVTDLFISAIFPFMFGLRLDRAVKSPIKCFVELILKGENSMMVGVFLCVLSVKMVPYCREKLSLGWSPQGYVLNTFS